MKKSVLVETAWPWKELTERVKWMINEIPGFLEEEDEELREHCILEGPGKLKLINLDIPLDELPIPGIPKELHLDSTVFEVEVDDLQMKLIQEHLGEVVIHYLGDLDGKTQVKLTLNLKTKGLGFALSTALKGAFLLIPETTMKETIQEWIDEDLDLERKEEAN